MGAERSGGESSLVAPREASHSSRIETSRAEFRPFGPADRYRTAASAADVAKILRSNNVLKFAVIFLLIALLAGALGLGGISSFAMGVSKFFFSVWGLIILIGVVLTVLAFRAFAS